MDSLGNTNTFVCMMVITGGLEGQRRTRIRFGEVERYRVEADCNLFLFYFDSNGFDDSSALDLRWASGSVPLVSWGMENY